MPIPRTLADTLACLLVAAAFAIALPVEAKDRDIARIRIDVSKNRGPVNPLLFGQNVSGGDGFGIFGDQHGVSNDADGLWDPAAKAPAAGVIELVDALRMGSLRYPGGCLAHNFNWKDAVGPLKQRPRFQFGIDEWIRLCRHLGAEPVFTVPDYFGTAEEAAELVEFLNAPATAAHPWAMKRAAWGRREPYGVKWFELGNESDHGNHNLVPNRIFTAGEYAAWARPYAAKMKAVDPTIKIGVVTPPTNGMDPECEWNTTVFREAGDIADFVVVHFYAPFVENTPGPADLPRIHEAVMAQTEQLGLRMDQLRAVIKKHAGRDLPLAITEFNTWAPFTKTPPYRFSFAPALQNADFLRLCLEPGQYERVSMTHYWHMFDGHWGALREGGKILHPAYAFFRLWGKHREALLLTPQVDAPRRDFAGADGLSPARGDRYIPARPISGPALVPDSYPAQPVEGPGFKIRATRNGFEARLENHSREAYPPLFAIPHPDDGKGRAYQVSFEARFDPDGPADPATRKSLGEFGLGLEDARGWAATNSATGVTGANMAADWTRFSGIYTLPQKGDTVRAIMRLIPKQPVTGTLRVRKLSIVRETSDIAPAYPLLTSSAMRSADGGRVSIVVFNKSLDRPLETEISLPGFRAASARYEQLTAPGGDFASTASPAEKSGELRPRVAGDVTTLRHTFPPGSMTGITLRR